MAFTSHEPLGIAAHLTHDRRNAVLERGCLAKSITNDSPLAACGKDRYWPFHYYHPFASRPNSFSYTFSITSILQLFLALLPFYLVKKVTFLPRLACFSAGLTLLETVVSFHEIVSLEAIRFDIQ